jgi:hypothetical protein
MSQNPQKSSELKILGTHVGIFVVYMGGAFLSGREDLLIIAGLLLVAHFVLCMGGAIYYRSWTWALSGLLVLIIGFATCVNAVKI